MTSETVLRFKSWVLGQSATKALIDKVITQTIRSEDATLIQLKAKPGDRFPVVLQDSWGAEVTIGTITITEVEEKTWGAITEADAYLGGFIGKEALGKALFWAGYRFKSLEEYRLFRIAFRWD